MIFRQDGFVVKIWGPPREHPPAHVHAHLGREGVIVIRLGRGGESPVVWQYFGVRRPDVVRAYRIVEAREGELIAAWEKLHGQA